MARIRSVHPGLWTDERFVALSPRARLVLLAVGTLADYADRFRFDRDIIRTHAGLGPIDQELDDLVAGGFLTVSDGIAEIAFAYGFRRRRVSKWENLRSIVFIRDGFRCRYCGSTEQPLHCDHVVPVSRGGTNDLSNLACACAFCNLSKGDKLLEEWLS